MNKEHKELELLIHADQQESPSQEHTLRIAKVDQLRAQGIQPWPENKEIDATCQQISDDFSVNADETREYIIAGRVMTLRGHGQTTFAHVQDATGKMQLYLRKDQLGDAQFEHWSQAIDMGDIVWIKGTPFKTKTGEITLKVIAFELLSKCLHPLPEKFHGLTDVEARYRQRYLDLISSPENRQKFITRSKVIRTMRSFFDEHGYIEVETPMLHPIPGGAAARPFVTHHNALNIDLYLRIAPELYLKRLIVGGLERVYEINRNFRNEGVSTRHNPEFTMIEFYTAYQDYYYIMNFVERLLKSIVAQSCEQTEIQFGQYALDFGKPFVHMTIKESVIAYGACTAADLTEQTIDATLKKHTIVPANKNASLGEKIYALFEQLVEPQLIQPTFISGFPIEVSPLAKRDAQDPTVAARFELFMAGMEIANGFNELNDPFDQAQRFMQQAQAAAGGDVEAHRFDADYIIALEHGLPPTVGVGIGIDRFIMILTNTTSIKDVILFPTLKKQR